MFEFQPCQYYQGFSQCFCIFWQVKTQRSKMQKTRFFYVYDVMLEYICAKEYTSQHTKKCKYIQKIIEMIFNLYEICYIY